MYSGSPCGENRMDIAWLTASFIVCLLKSLKAVYLFILRLTVESLLTL